MSLSGRTRLTVCLTRLQLRQALSRAQQALHELRRWRLDGPNATRAAATSLAILPFLARGHDHKTPGPYREHIARGIDFLVKLVGKDGNTVKDGETMYSQGLVAMTLCRAYDRTRDPALEAPAQVTLDFIMAAQHAGGGWSYQPMQPGGDTSALTTTTTRPASSMRRPTSRPGQNGERAWPII